MPPGDTTITTIVRGGEGAGGWQTLVAAPGEQRGDSVPRGDVLACLWHLSDLHICDCESPARLEYLDRYSDPDSPYRDILGDIGTYRPQESLTVHVATTMVATVNAMSIGPAAGAKVDVVVITGDLTDNAQLNELHWYQQILAGETVSPRSGSEAHSSWVGGSDLARWDERYWHPDGAPHGIAHDRPTRIYGYPTIPGLTQACRADVRSPGLTLPWLSVFGNHDGLLQGTVPISDAVRGLALGDERIIGLPIGVSPLRTAEAIPPVGPARYIHEESSPRVFVPRDQGRDLLSATDFPRLTRDDEGPNYFASDVGDLRVIALDTINPHGGWQGSIDEEQLAWLHAELTATTGRYILITSHHPSPTMINDFAPSGSRRVLGEELVSVLVSHPGVIAWIAGHVHFHAAAWRPGQGGSGFWEITTASLIDWPQQGRILEFVRTRERVTPEIAIISTVIDHGGPVSWSPSALSDAANLASISRSLAANDYRLRGGSVRGLNLESDPEVRNVVWRVPDPYA